MESFTVSFVIPALNEAHNIGNTLHSIHAAAKSAGLANTQVVVVDHGSADGTPEVAARSGATVIIHKGGTIGALRNLGARAAQGEVLVFIDADVTLTPEWSSHIFKYVHRIEGGEQLITGSHCAPPDSQNPLLKYWFSSLALDPRNTHVGTGHMIVGKSAFLDLDGFDPNLRTGEDYEFCERAKRRGFIIVNAHELKVTHHDFPGDLRSFVRREAWHGAGDLKSIQSALKSKVVIASSLFIFFHLGMLISLLSLNYKIFIACVILLACLLAASSYAKNKHMNPKTIAWSFIIFYFYYAGRSLAVVEKFLPARNKR